MEAQRHPDDYDGILAAAPAVHWDEFEIASLWPQVVMSNERTYPSVAVAVAVALGIAGAGGAGAVLHVFGVWAAVSGTAQVIVGLRRRGPELGVQWPTLLSGGLSFRVGITCNIQAAGGHPSLDVLAVYATGGGVWFVLQALLLGRKPRRARTEAVCLTP
jgi:uncharacterized membrane protein HdeD (DUF308 family)